MKVITRAVLDWDGNVLEEESYEYSGPVAECKSSGSSPQATNPYEQAAAQYGLSTGTADYNDALAHTNSVNPLGSSTWAVTGTDGSGPGSFGGYPTGFDNQNGADGYSAFTGSPGAIQFPGVGSYGLPSSLPATGSTGTTSSSASALNGGSGAPIYTNTTNLAPWADEALEQPINSYNVVGNAGVGQAANAAENATFNQQMQLLQPEEALQSEQTQSQLEAEGAMPGSAAYGTGEQMLGLQQGAQNAQVADNSVIAGQESLANQANIGSTELQNELATRAAPISEYDSLLTGSSPSVSASTPDISSAFAQQLQSQLAGYNANVATNNANTGAIAGVGAAAAATSSYWGPALASLFAAA